MSEPTKKVYVVLQEDFETGENNIDKSFTNKEDALAYLPTLMNDLLDSYREANPDMEFDFEDNGDSLEAEDMYRVSISESELL